MGAGAKIHRGPLVRHTPGVDPFVALTVFEESRGESEGSVRQLQVTAFVTYEHPRIRRAIPRTP